MAIRCGICNTPGNTIIGEHDVTMHASRDPIVVWIKRGSHQSKIRLQLVCYSPQRYAAKMTKKSLWECLKLINALRLLYMLFSTLKSKFEAFSWGNQGGDVIRLTFGTSPLYRTQAKRFKMAKYEIKCYKLI